MLRTWRRGRSVRPIRLDHPERLTRPSTPFSPAILAFTVLLPCLLLASGAPAAERTPIPPPDVDLETCLRAALAVEDEALPSGPAAPRPEGLPQRPRLAKRSGDPDGGDDVLAVTASNIQQPSLACAANGDLYLAVSQEDPVQNDWDIHVYRSQDGGKTWETWGFLGDGLVLTAHRDPVVLIPPGTNEACLVAYTYWSSGSNRQIRLARSATTGATASFTEVTAFSSPGIDFDRVDMATDAAFHDAYWVYLVAEADDGNGGDIWFNRSATQGQTVESAYAIASLTNSDRRYRLPRIDFGLGQRVHVSWQFELDSGDQAARYRNADDYANGGIGAWNGIEYLTSATNGIHERMPMVKASDHSDEVVLHYRRLNLDNVLQWSQLDRSSDRGSTWGVEPSDNFEPSFLAEVVELSDGEGWAWVSDDESEAQIKWCPLGGDFWTFPHDLMDRNYYDGVSWARVAVAPSRTHIGEVAMAWARVDVSPEEVWFDATWRDDPGYPNLEPGFPLALSTTPVSDPAVVDLDGDADLEIVYGDDDGAVQVLHHDGSPLAGWPRGVALMDHGAPVAVGDLHGDGPVEVVVGSTDGWVHALDASGEPLEGWPVDLGTGMDTYVSIGAVRPPYLRYVVACSSTKVWLLNYRGAVQDGFPWTFAGTHRAPAAIGDVDGDGYGEIVTVKDGWIHVNDPRSVSPQAYRKLTGEMFMNPASLGQVADGGDLEIVASTLSGRVFLMNSDLADRPGWPYTDPDGYPASAVALANVVGYTELELIFAHDNWKVHNFFHDGVEVSGWPVHTGSGWWIWGNPIVEVTDAVAPDILVGARDAMGYDWNGLSGSHSEWPKDLGTQCETTPAAGDLDQDGRMEVVFVGLTHLTVVDVGEYDPPWDGERGRWPMSMHDPQRTSCIDCGENLATTAPVLTRTSFRPPSPNPSTVSTTFRYSLRDRSEVELNVYDARGRLTRRLVQASQPSGWQQVTWDGRDHAGHRVANGAYFARLVVQGRHGEEVLTRRVVLMR